MQPIEQLHALVPQQQCCLRQHFLTVQQQHLLAIYAACDTEGHFQNLMDDVNTFYVTQAARFKTVHGRVAKQGVSGTLTGDKTKGPPVRTRVAVC